MLDHIGTKWSIRHCKMSGVEAMNYIPLWLFSNLHVVAGCYEVFLLSSVTCWSWRLMNIFSVMYELLDDAMKYICLYYCFESCKWTVEAIK